jgi:hypothetical protein
MSVMKYRLFRICLNVSLAFLMSGLLFKTKTIKLTQ